MPLTNPYENELQLHEKELCFVFVWQYVKILVLLNLSCYLLAKQNIETLLPQGIVFQDSNLKRLSKLWMSDITSTRESNYIQSSKAFIIMLYRLVFHFKTITTTCSQIGLLKKLQVPNEPSITTTVPQSQEYERHKCKFSAFIRAFYSWAPWSSIFLP